MSSTGYYVGLDVGGSTMKAGVVDEAGRLLAAVSLPTEAHRGQEAGLARMAETIRAAVAAAGLRPDEVAALGVATPGLLDLPGGVILEATNLRPWRDVPVRAWVSAEFGLPTAFQNDANAAALGEFWAGAGRGARSLVLFTLGTGVGGGIVWDGRIVEGRHGHGGEVGHHRIEMSRPRPCPCGRLGCLEAYASAVAVVGRTREALVESDGRSALARSGESLTARDVFEAAAAGDALAERVVEETAYYLAVGATNLMHIVNPDLVVFGGGMMAAGDGFLGRIRRHVREMAFPVPAERTRVEAAELGGDAGIIGAAACGRQLVRPAATSSSPARP